jgi:hypothetical protein
VSAPRRVLVATTTTPRSEEELRKLVRRHAGEDAEILVVAPASKISFLDWLTSAEDDARGEAEQRAERVADDLHADDVEARVGDVDPLIAIEDALRTFPADELIVVTPPDEAASWLEKGFPDALAERYGLPVTHLVGDENEAVERRA